METKLTYAQESWAEFWPEAQFLLVAHRDEVEPHARTPFVLNHSVCEALDASGSMLITSARSAESLVGYSIWFLSPQFDSLALAATQGPWFVMPEWRASGAGIRVFRKSLEALRARGVERVLPHHWGGATGPGLDKFFRRLGATPLETSYSLYLSPTHGVA